MKAELHDCCVHLMGSLLNGVYQGILISVLVSLVLRFWGRANAATRHAVWSATLLLVVFLIPAHYLLDQPAFEQDTDKQIAGGDLVPERNDERATVQLAALPDFGPNPGAPSADSTLEGERSDSLRPDRATEPMTGEEFVQPAFGDHEPDFDVGMPGLSSIDRGISAAVGQSATEAVEEMGKGSLAAPQGQRNAGHHWLHSKWLWPIFYSPLSATGTGVIAGLAFVWFFIFSGRLVALFWRLRQLRGISDQAKPAREGRLTELFRRLLRQAEVRRGVNLRITGDQRCPIVLGFLHPTILLPADMSGDLAAAEPVLRHELAHVRRYDDWANLIQHLIQASLFFHPAVLWIGKRLTLEREIACDDYVLREGIGRRTYALLLANVAERIQLPAPALAPGVSNSHSQLQQRISMILNTRRNSSPSLTKTSMASVVSLAVALAALSFYAAPRIVLAAASAEGTPTLPNASAVLSAPAAEPAPAVGGPGTIVAAADSPSVAPVGVDSGPKFKPDAPGTDPAASIDETPEPPAPSADFAPGGKVAPRAPKVGKHARVPQPPDFPDPAEGGDSSIDERLRKLEKMVRAIMEQQNPKRSHGAFEFNDGADQDWNNDQERMAKLKDQTERQAARAAAQAQRMVDQAKRATRDLQARIEDEDQGKGEVREALGKQLEALRKAREDLGREMGRLDQQIQKLEQEQPRGERDGQRRRSDAVRERMHADVSVTPEVRVTPDVVITPDEGR